MLRPLFIGAVALIAAVSGFIGYNTGRIEKPVISPTGIEIPPIKESDLLLPDLVLAPPSELYVVRLPENNRSLRYNTKIINQGKGTFEIIGHSDREKEKTFASQYMKRTDGTGHYKEVGTFVYHPTHNHWHIENHVQHKLFSVVNDQPGEELASTGKISFCLWDEKPENTDLEFAPKTRSYPRNCNSSTQGISVGWSDNYAARLDGQELNIHQVPDGTYFLRAEVNPDKNITESEYSNNVILVKVEIKNNRITKL